MTAGIGAFYWKLDQRLLNELAGVVGCAPAIVSGGIGAEAFISEGLVSEGFISEGLVSGPACAVRLSGMIRGSGILTSGARAGATFFTIAFGAGICFGAGAACGSAGCSRFQPTLLARVEKTFGPPVWLVVSDEELVAVGSITAPSGARGGLT